MADINDLAQQIAFYQGGGRPPGQTNGEKFNAGLSNVVALGKGFEDLAKERLAIKQAQLAQQPIGNYFGVPDQKTVDSQQALSGQAQQNYDQAKNAFYQNNPLPAQGPETYQQQDQMLANKPAPYVNPREQFSRQFGGMSPDTPTSEAKTVLPMLAMKSGTPFYYDSAGNMAFGGQPKPGMSYGGKLKPDQLANAVTKNRPQAVVTENQALAQGQVNPGTHLINTQNTGQLSPDAIERYARQFIQNKDLSQLGFMGGASRTAIMNRAAEIEQAAGHDASAMNINAAAYKAGTQELETLQKQRGSIMAFENTAQANVQNFLKTIDSIPDANSPLLNTPLRQLELKGAGDPDTAAFLAAQHVASQEISRVLQGNLSGAVTDSARQQAGQLLSGDYTANQFRAAVNILMQDMANRKAGYEQQIQETMGNLGGIGKTGNAPTQPAPNNGGGTVIKQGQGWVLRKR